MSKVAQFPAILMEIDRMCLSASQEDPLVLPSHGSTSCEVLIFTNMSWRVLLGINPMATVVEGVRWAMLGTPAPGAMTAVSVVVVAVALAGGVAYFRRMEGTFADVL